MVICVLLVVAVQVDPPASTQIAGFSRTILGHTGLTRRTGYKQLEFPVEGQGIFYDERVIVQSLAGNVHYARGLVTPSCRSRDSGQKCDEYHDEK
jgi:hypothetical protein